MVCAIQQNAPFSVHIDRLSGVWRVSICIRDPDAQECLSLECSQEHCHWFTNDMAAYVAQDLRLPGEHVDVNLHPTKREVGFLHQDQLIEAVCTAVEEKLTSSNTQ